MIFADSLAVLSDVAGKSHCICNQEAERDGCWCLAPLRFSLSLGPQRGGDCHPHSGWIFLALLNLSADFLIDIYRMCMCFCSDSKSSQVDY